MEGPGPLLPTPTAVAYGTNQSPTPGASVRPSLHTLAAGVLLPTPRASDTGTPGRRASAGFRPPLSQVVLPLLPTPTVADSRSSANATAGRRNPTGGHAGKTLTDATRLLPTPRASDGAKGCPGQRGSAGDLTLPAAAVRVQPTPTAPNEHGPGGNRAGASALHAAVNDLAAADADTARWGVYAPAVARWAALMGRPAPEPTQPGTHGKPVLAPALVEWLQGLPAGWVTSSELGLARTVALRVLGNGVVPQQAAAALRILLCPHRWQAPT